LRTMAFPSQKQESFFYGHVCAFEHFGGVPWRISYDNLSTAVRLMMEGKVRREQRQFVAFRSYYLFESHFCQPAAGWEKGGVEASVGFSRRNFLVPIPNVASFEELNLQLVQACLKDDQRRVSRQAETIGHMWERERPLLRSLPAYACGCCARSGPKADEVSRSSCGCCAYMSSIPLTWCNKRLSKRSPTAVRTWMGCCIAYTNSALNRWLGRACNSSTSRTYRRLAPSP